MDRGQAGTHVTQDDRPDPCTERGIGTIPHEAHTVVTGIGVDEMGEPTGTLPVELPVLDDESSQHQSMTADELGGGFHHDVRTVLQGTEKVRRCERVVYDERDTMAVTHLC